MDPLDFKSNRAGTVKKQTSGYYAFIPKPLPPEPTLIITAEILKLLEEAAQSIGELKGLTSIISDPELFVYLFVRKEALLSSQIEGTQCSLEDVLEEETNEEENEKHADIAEVSSYINAMGYALKKVKEDFPISNRLLKEIHAVLLKSSRGNEKSPGEFRRSQNWIGLPGATPSDAQFVPPPDQELDQIMSDFEKYIHSDNELPPLINAALLHAQFETIHPFLDGNGRLGRLLITLLLCSWKILDKPLIYISYFFKANRTEYYQKLTNVRQKGDWEKWVVFFLRGIVETSKIAQRAARDINSLHENDRKRLQEKGVAAASVQRVFELFCHFPIRTIPDLAKDLPGSNHKTLNFAVNTLVELGIIENMSKKKRNRRFCYREYLSTLTRDTATKIG